MAKTTAANIYDDNDDVELGKPLVGGSKSGNKKKTRSNSSKSNDNGSASLYQRFMLTLDERWNVKVLMTQWQPRFELLVRLLLVASFFDDSFRMVSNFNNHVTQVAALGYGQTFATAALSAGLIVQLFGALAVVANVQQNIATMALIGWTIAQPILYAQLSNAEFLAESVSLIGGLLLLRAHVIEQQQDDEGSLSSSSTTSTQFIGRLLLPAMFVYYAGVWIVSAMQEEETASYFQFMTSLSSFMLVALLSLGLMISAGCVAVGLKSRLVATILALLNIGYVFYQHPFFRYAWRDDMGVWQYDENMPMPSIVVQPTTTDGEDGGNAAAMIDYTELYDLHKYYFFLGLSTSGAFFLLALFGPGQIAIQKKEVLLPAVARARD